MALDDLNDEQRAAATHPPGEAAILLAGAGSGKTTTLTERIAWLVSQGVPPRRILALTFTNKAAAEIRERVLRRTGLSEEEAPRLSTIHSLALSLIRKNPKGFGLGERVSPLSDYDQIELLKKIIERSELDLNPYTVQEQIAFHRARGIGFVEDYTDEVHKRAEVEHAGYHALYDGERKVWRLFAEEKMMNSAIDFDDMVWFVLRRMERDPEWLAKLQTVFQYVMMDEAQDSNVPQFRLTENLLSPLNRNFMAVGDLGQSIYSFQGAQPELLERFAEGWRGGPPVQYRLARNHRSVTEIVEFANRIREKMNESLPLTMVSFRGLQGEKGAMRITRAGTPSEIARGIAYKIVNAGRPWKEFALLVRSSMQVREIEGELVRARIPYVVRGGRSLLQTEEVRDVLAYVKLAANPRDFAALARAAAAPKRGVGDVALENVRARANQAFSGDLLLAGASVGGKLSGFVAVVKQVQDRLADPVKALNTAIGFSGYPEYLRRKYAKDPEKVQTKIENLARLRMMIEGLAATQELSTEDLIFQLTMEKPEKEDEKGAVTISTIHSAKGLEWPVVWVTNLVESQLPHWRSCGSEKELNEERRLFYVAVTRGRDTCTLCVPEKYLRGEKWTEVTPSRFLTELGIE